MSNYRMIACSVGDYDPAEMTIEKIEALDESDQGYFTIEEGDFFNALKVNAVEICAEWWESQLGAIEENSDKDKLMELMGILLQKTISLSQMKLGDTVTGVCSMNDWIKIEKI